MVVVTQNPPARKTRIRCPRRSPSWTRSTRTATIPRWNAWGPTADAADVRAMVGLITVTTRSVLALRRPGNQTPLQRTPLSLAEPRS